MRQRETGPPLADKLLIENSLLSIAKKYKKERVLLIQ
jgi:hypothetical protein